MDGSQLPASGGAHDLPGEAGPGGAQAGQQAPRISEAELQRTADQVYRMIEDRIRRERRRLGL